MAIKKDLREQNGIETNYHKIQSIIIENNNNNITCKINILNYLNEEYREKEKNKNNIKNQIDEYNKQLNDEFRKEQYDEVLVNDIAKKISDLEFIYNSNDYYSISNKEIIIENCEDEFNFSDFYEMLKKYDEFNNSKDC